MSFEPTPENNLILRQLASMRREMAESRETNARVVELLGRMNLRMDDMAAGFNEGLGRVDRRVREAQSDLLLVENRILSAISELRNLSARLDEAEAMPIADSAETPTPPSRHG